MCHVVCKCGVYDQLLTFFTGIYITIHIHVLKHLHINISYTHHPSLSLSLYRLMPYVRGNVGFVFTKDDLREVKKLILSIKVCSVQLMGWRVLRFMFLFYVVCL